MTCSAPFVFMWWGGFGSAACSQCELRCLSFTWIQRRIIRNIAEFSSVDLWLGIQEKQMYSSNFIGASCQRLILTTKWSSMGCNGLPDCCFLLPLFWKWNQASLVRMTSVFWQQACQICAAYWSYHYFVILQFSKFSLLLGLAGGGRAWVASHATTYFRKKYWEEMFTQM